MQTSPLPLAAPLAPCSASGKGENPDRSAGRPLPSSSLDHLETKSQPASTDSDWQTHVHRRFAEVRTRTVRALRESNDEKLRYRAERIASCCACPMVAITSTGKPIVHAKRCRDRCCPLCAAKRADELAVALQDRLADADAVRFVTLTLKHRNEPLGLSIEKLHRCFQQLRRREAWKHHVDGGYATIETKRDENNQGWHVHLHCLITGHFFPHHTLKAEWLAVTGDSSIVDIRPVQHRHRAARYLTKYVAKGNSGDDWSDDWIREHARDTTRVRMAFSFGTMRGKALSDALTAQDKEKPLHSVSVGYVHHHACKGNSRAQRAATLLWKAIPQQCTTCNLWRPPAFDFTAPFTADDAAALATDIAVLQDSMGSGWPPRELTAASSTARSACWRQQQLCPPPAKRGLATSAHLAGL